MKRRHITAMFGLMIMAMAVGISVCAEEHADAAARAIADRKEEAEEVRRMRKSGLCFLQLDWKAGQEQIEFRKR